MVDFPKNNRYMNLANQSINELADNNFGTRLKAGDTTKLSYLLLDGNGDSLDLEGFTATAVLKKDNLVAYKKDATLINDDGQYRCEFKITDVLEPSEKAYVVEFVLTKGEDKYIYPSDNDIPLTIEPSSLSAEEDIIRTSSEEIITGIIKGMPAVAKVDEHIANSDVHVTADDKVKWNANSAGITRLDDELSKKQTKLVAGDNVAINQDTNEISVNVPDDVVRKNATNQIELTADPTRGNHATRKSYVDRKISEVNLSGYARANHTHTSSDISDSITRIGTSASANKLVKTDSDGFIDFVAPSDSSPDKSVILKGYLDTKLGQKADSHHNHDSSYYQKTEYVSDPGASDKANKPLKSNASGGLTLTNTPAENTDAVNKLYVDSKLADISLPDSGMTQSQADERYARTSHTHDSADITNTTNRIGTSASANKVVKLDSRGFLDIVTPNDSSPGNSVIVKSYMDSKLNEKASASELETLRNTVTQLQNKIQELEANAGKVKNTANDTYLDVWVGSENQKPNDSTDKLVFVEKE